jgi:hypothetical protein
MFSRLIERFGTGLDVSAIMREVERSAGGQEAEKEGKP